MNPNDEDSNGITLLIEACVAGNEKKVRELLGSGYQAQPVPPFRHTPLRGAAIAGQYHIIPILLEAGADPNSKSEGSRTALMGACFLRNTVPEENQEVVSELCVKALLADQRTDPTIINDFGETAFDLAKARGYEQSARLIEDALVLWQAGLR